MKCPSTEAITSGTGSGRGDNTTAAKLLPCGGSAPSASAHGHGSRPLYERCGTSAAVAGIRQRH